MIRMTSSYIIANFMQHIADFLSARDLLALSQTCARIRFPLLVGGWKEQLRARFPYKKRTECDDPMLERWQKLLKFLLILESRVADAPPHGQARRFLAAFEPRDNWDHILCDEHVFKHHQLGMLYVPRADLIIRGDILIDDRARMFIFDGYRCHHVPCINEVYQSLAVVFNIPFEFDITYYGRGIWRGCNIGFQIDDRVKYEKINDAKMTFSHDDKTYIIDTHADLFKSWSAMTCHDFYTQPRNCATYHLELFD